MYGLLNGRLGRRGYWTSLGLIALACAASAVALRAGAGMAAAILWIVPAVGRLHDIGRSGWWAAGVLAFDAAAIGAAAPVGPLMVGPIAYLALLLLTACAVGLGLAGPDPADNRFGPASRAAAARPSAA